MFDLNPDCVILRRLAESYNFPESRSLNEVVPLWDITFDYLAWPVGSQTIDGASNPDSDYDYLVFWKKADTGALAAAGFVLDNSGKHYDPANSDFNSWRCGKLNLITTRNAVFASRFLTANALAKRLKLLNRDDRVALFRAVLYSDNGVLSDV